MPGRAIGWLGTGRMGTAIAGRLLDAGRPVTVWNRTADKTGPLAVRGALVADSIAGLAACDVVFVMVSGPADLEQVVLGDGLRNEDFLSLYELQARAAGLAPESARL